MGCTVYCRGSKLPFADFPWTWGKRGEWRMRVDGAFWLVPSQARKSLPGCVESPTGPWAQSRLFSICRVGTEAELTVPARIAYGTEHRRKGLGLFRKSKVESWSPDKN